MKAFDALTTQKFENLEQLLNYSKKHKLVCSVDPDTKDRIYALNPTTNRSYTFLVKENKDRWLYLTKIQRQYRSTDRQALPGRSCGRRVIVI